jgi:hypothetical protein
VNQIAMEELDYADELLVDYHQNRRRLCYYSEIVTEDT